MFKSVDESLIDSIIDSFESNNGIFRVTRNELLKERVSVILKSKKGEGTELFDCIDVLVKRRQEAEHFKICLQCNSKAPVTLKTCKVYKGKLARLEVSTEESQQEKVNLYSHFKAKEKSNAINVMVGEPDMLNPNSFENLSVILRSLGQRAKIAKYSPLISEAESRKWVFIENVGGILNPVLKLIFNVYRCLDFNEEIYRQKNFESHLCSGAIHGNKSFEFD